MKKIHLVGCLRYNLGGDLFIAKEIYALDDAKADYLLAQTDDQSGYPYFEPYTGTQVGVSPAAPEADILKAPRTERPIRTERPVRTERPGRVPRTLVATDARPGQSTPTEDADAVTV